MENIKRVLIAVLLGAFALWLALLSLAVMVVLMAGARLRSWWRGLRAGREQVRSSGDVDEVASMRTSMPQPRPLRRRTF